MTLLLALLLAGLATDRPEPVTAGAARERCYAQGARTGCVRAPASLARDPALLVYLHGYGGDGRDDSLGLAAEAERAGFVYAFAQGSPDAGERLTWATIDASATGLTSATDDVAFLAWFVDNVRRDLKIAPGRVAIAGWSLGALMALRFACEQPEKVAAVYSYAGSLATEHVRCAPSKPVSVLLAHGAADEVIRYAGGKGSRSGLVYAGARTVFETWAKADGCTGTAESLGRIDLHETTPGAECVREEHRRCKDGSSVALWTLEGAGHRPAPTKSGAGEALRFLQQHLRR